MVCLHAARTTSLWCPAHPVNQLVPLPVSTPTSSGCTNASLSPLTWQAHSYCRWQSKRGLPAGNYMQPAKGRRRCLLRASAEGARADLPADSGATSSLQSVVSPATKTPAVEAGSRAGRRGRGGGRSKVKRRLVLLRHAKSSFADLSIKDHDRPLDEDGRASAREVAAKLKTAGWVPKLVLCSDSYRTRETLAVMQSVVAELAEAETRFLGSYYTVCQLDGQTAGHLRETICKYAADAFATVMCMGHNRGWEEAASDFTGQQLELKTANAALLETTGDSWEDAFEHTHKGGWKLCGLLTPNSAG